MGFWLDERYMVEMRASGSVKVLFQCQWLLMVPLQTPKTGQDSVPFCQAAISTAINLQGFFITYLQLSYNHDQSQSNLKH